MLELADAWMDVFAFRGLSSFLPGFSLSQLDRNVKIK